MLTASTWESTLLPALFSGRRARTQCLTLAASSATLMINDQTED